MDMFRFLESTAAQYMTSNVKSVTRQCTHGRAGNIVCAIRFRCAAGRGQRQACSASSPNSISCAPSRFTTGQLVPSYDELMKRTVGDVMTEGIVHVEPTTPLTRVLQLMVNLTHPQLSGLGPRPRIAGHDLARRRDARAQAGDAGRQVDRRVRRPPSPACTSGGTASSASALSAASSGITSWLLAAEAADRHQRARPLPSCRRPAGQGPWRASARAPCN